MIEHVWSVLCSKSIIDRDTKNVTIVDVLEEVTFEASLKPPNDKDLILNMDYHVVSLWNKGKKGKAEKGQYKISIFSPQKKKLAEQKQQIDLTKYQRLRSVVKSNGLPFGGEGTYRFKISLQKEGEANWRKVAEIPLVVKVDIKSS